MVAVMTDLLELKPDDVVLEIGTGLGYQSAVLAELASRVYSVDVLDCGDNAWILLIVVKVRTMRTVRSMRTVACLLADSQHFVRSTLYP